MNFAKISEQIFYRKPCGTTNDDIINSNTINKQKNVENTLLHVTYPRKFYKLSQVNIRQEIL